MDSLFNENEKLLAFIIRRLLFLFINEMNLNVLNVIYVTIKELLLDKIKHEDRTTTVNLSVTEMK